MNFIQRPNKNGDKITFYYDYGRATGQRPSIDAGTSDGYFVKNPTANIPAVSNPSVGLKVHLEVDE